MIWSKKPDTKPLGVPLGDLLLMLRPTSLKTRQEGDALVVSHEHYTTRVAVLPPKQRTSENGPIRAVLRITTELPASLQAVFKSEDATVAMNTFTALGALTTENGKVFVGSRLTIYEEEDSWSTLHLPLVLFTVLGGTEAILGGLRRAFSKEGNRGGDSEWTESDMEQVQNFLSNICVCSQGGLGLTAEFGLKADAVSAVQGDHCTALFQMMADEPHPELGGGLFCLLQMPHQISDPKRLNNVCVQLNRMEMAPHDQPPHFGAWCEGKLGGNPAYVSFLPNALHSASSIAVNTAIWAAARARWANEALRSLGVVE